MTSLRIPSATWCLSESFRSLAAAAVWVDRGARSASGAAAVVLRLASSASAARG